MRIFTEKFSRFQRLESNFNMISGSPFEVLLDVINGTATINFTDDNGDLLENSADILKAIVEYHKSKIELEKYFPK